MRITIKGKSSYFILAIVIIMVIFFSLSTDSTISNIFNKRADIPAYYFKNFEVNINVLENNSYEITETVDVYFTEERHGLIWKIPTKTYMNRYAKISNGRVEGYKYTTSPGIHEYTIKIGDENILVSGDQKYKISYKYTKGFDALTKMDELYFNIIGTGHSVKIEKITFTITMPKAFDSSELNFTYGKLRSTENSGIEYVVTNNTIRGKLSKGLGPNEALTVALPLPEGYYVNTWRDINDKAIMGDYYEFMYLFLLIIAIILWGLFLKNRRIFPTVQFKPPDGLKPPEIGYIHDGEVDSYDITSLIIYWASKNKLMIKEETKHEKKVFRNKKKSEITFYKIEGLEKEAPDYEKKIFNTMFNICGDREKVSMSSLTLKFGDAVSLAKIAIKKRMQENKKTRIFTNSRIVISFILKILCFINAFWFCSVIEYGIYKETKEGIPGLIFAMAICIPMWSFCKFLARWNNSIPRFRIKRLIKRLLWLLITFIGILCLTIHNSSPLMFISGYIVCFIISLMSSFNLKRTKYGEKQMEKIIGFKDYILNAEKDRIIMLVEENPDYFFDILPYAMTLGITDKWARRFEGIALAPPEWYGSSSRHVNNYNEYYFTQEFRENMDSIAESISSAQLAYSASVSTSNSRSSSSGGWAGNLGGGSAGGGDGGSDSSDW